MESTCSFTHSFHKYLLDACKVLGTVVGAEGTEKIKIGKKVFAFKDGSLVREKKHHK